VPRPLPDKRTPRTPTRDAGAIFRAIMLEDIRSAIPKCDVETLLHRIDLLVAQDKLDLCSSGYISMKSAMARPRCSVPNDIGAFTRRISSRLGFAGRVHRKIGFFEVGKNRGAAFVVSFGPFLGRAGRFASCGQEAGCRGPATRSMTYLLTAETGEAASPGLRRRNCRAARLWRRPGCFAACPSDGLSTNLAT